MGPIRIAVLAAFAGLSVGVGLAGAKESSITKSSRLWATVNVCDTPRHPNQVGVRVSMPGSGVKREKMYARIQLQYFDSVSTKWKSLGKAADSGWLSLGSSKYLRREGGSTFKLQAPAAGQLFRIRGFVRYEWRRQGTAIRRAQKVTAGRLSDVKGADPATYSAAECWVTAP